MEQESHVRTQAGAAGTQRRLETLRDGSQVRIRPLSTADREAERAFIEGLSPEARRFRFFCAIRQPSEALLDVLTHVDQRHKVAFAAVATEGAHERIVGVSRYTTDRDQRHAECAVIVADDWEDKGLGTALMRHLIEYAKTQGVIHLRSTDRADNLRMRELAGFLGFHVRVDPADARQVIYELSL